MKAQRQFRVLSSVFLNVVLKSMGVVLKDKSFLRSIVAVTSQQIPLIVDQLCGCVDVGYSYSHSQLGVLVVVGGFFFFGEFFSAENVRGEKKYRNTVHPHSENGRHSSLTQLPPLCPAYPIPHASYPHPQSPHFRNLNLPLPSSPSLFKRVAKHGLGSSYQIHHAA